MSQVDKSEADELTRGNGWRAGTSVPVAERAAPMRTVITVMLMPEAETHTDVISCTVEAINALPAVADVSTRRVRPRSARPGVSA